jgi:hypothetical protein
VNRRQTSFGLRTSNASAILFDREISKTPQFAGYK